MSLALTPCASSHSFCCSYRWILAQDVTVLGKLGGMNVASIFEDTEGSYRWHGRVAVWLPELESRRVWSVCIHAALGII